MIGAKRSDGKMESMARHGPDLRASRATIDFAQWEADMWMAWEGQLSSYHGKESEHTKSFTKTSLVMELFKGLAEVVEVDSSGGICAIIFSNSLLAGAA